MICTPPTAGTCAPATWATNRDIDAARLSWERAHRIADALPADDPDRAAMRIAPRTMLCGIAWRVHVNIAGDRFEELRELCTAAGDKASLAIAMAGLVMDHAYPGPGARGVAAGIRSHGPHRVDRRSDLDGGAVLRGRSTPRSRAPSGVTCCAGHRGSSTWPTVTRLKATSFSGLRWRSPSRRGLLPGIAWVVPDGATTCGTAWPWPAAPTPCPTPRSSPTSTSRGYRYGVLRPDDSAVREIEDALRIAERSGDDLALAVARMTLGVALVHRHTAAERDRGQKLLAEVSEVFLRRGYVLCDLPIVEVYVARERARRGDRDEAIPLMRAAVDHLFREGQLLAWGVPATGVLVETLLDRGADGDVAEAEAAIERLAAAPADEGLVIRDIWLLRLRALLARAHGDDAAYRDLRDRYRDMAERLASKDISRGPRR